VSNSVESYLFHLLLQTLPALSPVSSHVALQLELLYYVCPSGDGMSPCCSSHVVRMLRHATPTREQHN